MQQSEMEMEPRIGFRAHVYDFMEAKPPARTALQKWGLRFELATVALIAINIVSFILSTKEESVKTSTQTKCWCPVV
jgi:hypothetical protein